MRKVESYYDYIKTNRKNVKLPDFDFDVNMFENLIDCWTDKDMIPVILRTSEKELDRFCSSIYGMDFDQTYRVLSGITDAYMKTTFKNLASYGNATAMNIVSEHLMKLKRAEEDKSINIRIVNDLASDDEENS